MPPAGPMRDCPQGCRGAHRLTWQMWESKCLEGVLASQVSSSGPSPGRAGPWPAGVGPGAGEAGASVPAGRAFPAPPCPMQG